MIAVCLIGYSLLAGLAVNLTYHRALAHHALRLPKILERVLVTLGLPAGTPIQWVGNHRYHHRFADEPNDPHSPRVRGFWFAHVGWYIGTDRWWLCALYAVAGPLRTVYDGWHRPRSNQEFNSLAADIAADPYYRWLSARGPYFIGCMLHVAIFFGFAGFAWGARGIAWMWGVSILAYNVGDAVDSVAHLVGRKRPGSAEARNHWVLGWLALGEGWHANHHVQPQSARHGIEPGQFDWTWQVIRILAALGCATQVRLPEVPYAASDRDAAA